MLSNLYRHFTNAIYSVGFKVQQYKNTNPEATVLAAGATKARKFNEEDEVKSGLEWAAARRATLILTTEKLVCGSWDIPLAEIQKAQLLKVKSLLANAFILKISTINEHYQFGLQYDPAWEEQTALKLTIEDGKIKRSLVMRLFRLIAILYLAGMCFWTIFLTYRDLFSDF